MKAFVHWVAGLGWSGVMRRARHTRSEGTQLTTSVLKNTEHTSAPRLRWHPASSGRVRLVLTPNIGADVCRLPHRTT